MKCGGRRARGTFSLYIRKITAAGTGRTWTWRSYVHLSRVFSPTRRLVAGAWAAAAAAAGSAFRLARLAGGLAGPGGSSAGAPALPLVAGALPTSGAGGLAGVGSSAAGTGGSGAAAGLTAALGPGPLAFAAPSAGGAAGRARLRRGASFVSVRKGREDEQD